LSRPKGSAPAEIFGPSKVAISSLIPACPPSVAVAVGAAASSSSKVPLSLHKQLQLTQSLKIEHKLQQQQRQQQQLQHSVSPAVGSGGGFSSLRQPTKPASAISRPSRASESKVMDRQRPKAADEIGEDRKADKDMEKEPLIQQAEGAERNIHSIV
jgi:hypothetical protein